MGSLVNCSTEELNGSDIWNPHIVLALGIPQMITNLVAAAFNCTVIFTISFSKDLNHPIFLLFCNLAVSDLLVSVSGFWISLCFIGQPDSTIFGSRSILVAYVAYAVSILSTVYNLVSIGIERYLTVSGRTRLRCRASRNQVFSAIFINWTLAIILGSLPLMGWDCLKKDGFKSTLYGPFCIDYLAFITIPNCMVALVLPLTSYIGIIIKVRKQKLCMQAHGQHHSTYKAAEVHVAKTCIFIWILAVVSYAPFFGGVLWDILNTVCPEELQTSAFVFRNVSATMITLNSLGNPIIYTFKFKLTRDNLTICKCQSKNQISAVALRNF
ncbi:lysophosphatidic acid receptor 1-like [Pelobates cultripes]|uniref:Lysophosphatidic acid receptor 1-like n=1 Tax=Pelobates cultripes TaxID=61616 RepID=A0AAD1R2B1_PELCU|nr:lysophosphatidic acid receptor 1-like [Pelobates cultripes]